MRTRFAALAALGIAALVGPGTAIASADTPTPNDTTGAYACSLLTTVEVADAFGVPVQAVPHGANPPAGAEAGTSSCLYVLTSNPAQTVIMVRVQTTTDAAAAKHLAGLDVRPPLHPVHVGDLAQMINGTTFQ